MKPDPHRSPEQPAPGRHPQVPVPPSGPDDQGAHPPARTSGAISFEQIRERAYELWERNHRPEGFEIEFWLLAERELRQERERDKPGDPPQ